MHKSLYLHRDTVVHHLDPRAKLAGLLVLCTLPFLFNDPRYVTVVAAMVIAVATAAGCLSRLYSARHLYLLLFVVNFVLWQLSLPGHDVLARLGPVTVTWESVLYGLAAALRFIVVMMVGLLFVSCTSSEEITVALTALRLPYTTALVVSMAARLVPMFIATAGVILQAQAARGFATSGRNPVGRVRHTVPVIIPLILYALRHASLMSLAIEARGFTPGAPRTSAADPHLGGRDVVTLVALAVVLAACVAARMAGLGVIVSGRI